MDSTMSGVRLETKTVQARVTEAKADGTATALVSVFGNVDLGGDRVMPGAFTRTLSEWQAKGDPIPVIWSHDWDNPESFVGWADPATITETDQGLVVPMKFDTDRPRAEQVHHLLKERRVTQFSFGYFVRAFQDVEDPDYGTVRELTDVDLFEVGPTLLGMNPETELLAAASALRAQREAQAAETQIKEIDQSAHPATSRQVALYGALEEVVDIFGKFDQTTGPDGAHYVAADANPFAADGMQCSNCVFYEGPRACEIVDGDIDPAAVCKFWVIPGDLMTGQDNTPDAPMVESASADDMDGKTTDDPATDSPGDTQGTIPSEHITALLTRPRYTEE